MRNATASAAPLPPIGRTAHMLGLAGLLPALGAVAWIGAFRGGAAAADRLAAIAGYWLAMGYAALILSFLGGIWWGMAMRRATGQGTLATLAILPSLIAMALLIAAAVAPMGAASGWVAVALGSVIATTLIVDRRLASTGDAPPGWMRLRTPLSLGLGALTITAGALFAA